MMRLLRIRFAKGAGISPLAPRSGRGSQRFDGGNRRDWFPRGLGAMPAPKENSISPDKGAYRGVLFLRPNYGIKEDS